MRIMPLLCYVILKQNDSNIFYKHFILIIIASNDIIVSNIASANVLNNYSNPY